MGIKPDKEEQKERREKKEIPSWIEIKRGQFFYNVTPTHRQRERKKHTPSSVLHTAILLGSPWRRNERPAIFFFFWRKSKAAGV
jgi:hypothetical protein